MLDIPVQCRRNKAVAKQCFRRLLKGRHYVPRVLITDKRASCGAAQRGGLPSVEHRQHRRLNNRAGHAHHPTRERARGMRRYTSQGQARCCRAASGPRAARCRPRRQRLTAAYRQIPAERFAAWRASTGTPALA